MPGPFAEIVTILQNGVNAINALNKQIAVSVFSTPFPLAAMDASVYRTGTWTPTPTFATPGDLAFGGATLGTYVKWGPQVYAGLDIVSTTWTFTTSSGNFQITGLPFPASDRGAGAWAHLTGFTAFSAAAYTYTGLRVQPSGSLIDLLQFGTLPALNAVSTTIFTTGTQIVMRSYVQYLTAVST
jgi:hypothetical protein